MKNICPPPLWKIVVLIIWIVFPSTVFAAWQCQEASPTHHTLRAIWGSSATDVFAVGDGGSVLHDDGTAWMEMRSTTDDHLNGVWGTAADNVFAVGNNGALIHYDGAAWSKMDSHVTQNLNGIWGLAGDQIFAVGDGGTIITYNGEVWHNMDSPVDVFLAGIWGTSADSIFAVGGGGVILHYDGSAWHEIRKVGSGDDLFGIWGDCATHIYAVGGKFYPGGLKMPGMISSLILHYDGDAWSSGLYSIASSTSPSAGKLRSVWGVATNDVFAVGDSGKLYHFDGADWGIMNSDTDNSLNAIWSASADDIYIVGQNGAMLHYWPEIVAPPQLVITKNGYSVTFSWTPVANASGYFFWFDMVGPGSGFDGAFDYIFDMHTTRELSAELWPGATFYVCVQGHDRNTLGYPSTIEYLHTP